VLPKSYLTKLKSKEKSRNTSRKSNRRKNSKEYNKFGIKYFKSSTSDRAFTESQMEIKTKNISMYEVKHVLTTVFVLLLCAKAAQRKELKNSLEQTLQQQKEAGHINVEVQLRPTCLRCDSVF